MRQLFIPLLVLLAGSALSQSTLRRAPLVLNHPCPEKGASFGHSTCVLDMDGVGGPEIAVGAYGQGQVFVHHDVSMTGFNGLTTYMVTGVVSCGAPTADDHFGYDVAAGNLDDDPQDELVVGAPHAWVGPVEKAGVARIFRFAGDTNPVSLRELTPTSSWFGDSVTVGDFDGDGNGDVCVSAPKTEIGGVKAGSVHVFFGPFDVVPPVLVIPNPQPILHGNFGQHLAVADLNADGFDDLCVAAIGNSNQAGLAFAGQIYVYPGPIDPAVRILVEDPAPDPNDLPGPRFGMHITAREDWLLIGANRKDWNLIHDAGMGFSSRGPTFATVNLHPYPDPADSDYMGFRCAVANVLGDSALDLTFVVMGQKQELVTWDGNSPLALPARKQATIPGSADHFGNGLVPAQITAGGYEELVVGDGTYDLPGTGKTNDTGRVVIYAYD